MHNSQVETLAITSLCSGGCLPCPFSGGELPQRFLAAEELLLGKIRRGDYQTGAEIYRI
jgi:hypothetical protein